MPTNDRGLYDRRQVAPQDGANIVPLDGNVELRFVVGNFSTEVASGGSARHALALQAKSIDLTTLPCTCQIAAPCPACLAHDARSREREARQGSLK
jgi:hypothetical protein